MIGCTGRGITIIAVTRAGAGVARRLGAAMPEARVAVPERFAALGDEAHWGAGEAVVAAFEQAIALVLVMATGIAVRLVAPHLKGKRMDPAVVVVDDAARFAISLLSGHLGGANALAERVACLLGATAVVTTASEATAFPSPDLIAASQGWRLDPCSDLTGVAAALVNGDPVGVVQECGRGGWLPKTLPPHVKSYATVGALVAASPAAALIVSDRASLPLPRELAAAVYRPPTLVIGAGSSKGAPATELIELARQALASADLAGASVGLVATIDLKRDEPGIVALAEHFGVPLRTFGAAELDAASGDWQRSEIVRRAVGSAGVCEPAALLAAGTGELLVQKCKSAHATVAIARCREGI